jgi:hypothetical protein
MQELEKQEYIRELLQAVETRLNREGRDAEARRMGTIACKMTVAPNVMSALDNLYLVEGFDRFALKLMWYLERSDEVVDQTVGEDVIGYQAIDLVGSLPSRHLDSRGLEATCALMSAQPQRDLASALEEFTSALGAMSRQSLDEENFRGIEENQVVSILDKAAALRALAMSHGNGDVARFSSAFSLFLRYVVERGLLKDVRVANFMDSANLTLQTVMETVGAEDYDSLQQCIQLLEDPAKLLQ